MQHTLELDELEAPHSGQVQPADILMCCCAFSPWKWRKLYGLCCCF